MRNFFITRRFFLVPAQHDNDSGKKKSETSHYVPKHARAAPTSATSNYTLYWPPEILRAIDFVANHLKKHVYLIGIRALYEQHIPIYRGTEDIDLYSPITIEERNELGKFLRKEFVGTAEYWRKFGTAFIFPSRAELDLNRAVELYDELWDRRKIRINDADVYVPPIEDIVAMKILAGRPKDLKDIKHVFRTSWALLDKERLFQKAARVEADRKLAKVAKSMGYKV
jgi:hypothetical protein